MQLQKRKRQELEQFYLDKFNYIDSVIQHFPRRLLYSKNELNFLYYKEKEPEDEETAAIKKRLEEDPEIRKRLFPGKEKKSGLTSEELELKLSNLKNKNAATKKTKPEAKEKVKNKKDDYFYTEKHQNQQKKRQEKNRLVKLQRAEKTEEKIAKKSDTTTTVDEAPRKVSIIQEAIKTEPNKSDDVQMMYSKLDFAELSTQKEKKHSVIKDPATALKKIKEKETKIEKLIKQGNVDEVKEMLDKKMVERALLKSEGVKVKDDPEMLKSTLMRRKQLKERRKKKWDERKKRTEKMIEEKQKKRKDHIKNRARTKKLNKLKRSAKKGKIVPGF